MDDQNQVELYGRGHRADRLDRRGLSALDTRLVELPDSYEILEPGETLDLLSYGRSEERRVGKESRHWGAEEGERKLVRPVAAGREPEPNDRGRFRGGDPPTQRSPA